MAEDIGYGIGRDSAEMHLRRDIDLHHDGMTQQNTYDSHPSYCDNIPSSAPVREQHITTVSHVAFSDALLAQKPKPFTKIMFKLYFFLFVAFLNSCINGYDGSLMGGINAMETYQQYVYAPRPPPHPHIGEKAATKAELLI